METAPRLAPLDQAPSVATWLFMRLSRWLLGKVMMPARVIYTRMPRLLWPQMLMYRLAARGLSLPPLLVHRVQIRVSMRHGCAFCTDIHQAIALREGHDRARLDATGAEPVALDPAEQAALAYVDELCAHTRASEATFAAARAHLGERQLVELTWLYAFTTYLNRLAAAFAIGSDDFCGVVTRPRG